MLSLAWPWMLMVLPLPWLITRYVPRASILESALFVPCHEIIYAFDRKKAFSSSHFRLKKILLIIIWILLILAASRPQFIGDPLALPASGRDLMLAVDISGSMAQEDMAKNNQFVSRISVVKNVVNDFIEKRVGDRIGLILFGTEPYIHVPFTFDRQAVKTLFNEAEIGFAGEQTSLGDAIGLAVKHLVQQPAEGRVLILLTDGRNTSGSIEPLQATRLAAQTRTTIYTVGVGADEMIVETFFGKRRVNPSADLDEHTLQQVAEITSGKYFRARDSKELEEIYTAIDRLEPLQQDQEIFRPVKALYFWPLAGAFLSSMFLACLYLPMNLMKEFV